MHKKIDGEKVFSYWDGILMYGKEMVIFGALKKGILKDFHSSHPSKDESFNEKLCVFG